MTQFPAFMPDTGMRVPDDPADFLRDVFLANKGRITAELVANMVGRHTFTYGAAITESWQQLQDEGYAVRDGNDWVWPLQEFLFRPAEITIKGRTFTVEVSTNDNTDRPGYRLTGTRGADYKTFRMEREPDMMFLVGFGKSRNGGFTINPLGRNVWLTDADGTLKVR